MTNTHYLLAFSAGIVLFLLFIVGQVDAEARSGQAIMATSSTIQVGPQQDKTLFTSNYSCASRVISTAQQAIMLAFSSTINPGGDQGHWQAASTTVAYDSAIYGCTAVTAYAAASSTITIAELSQ